MDERKEYFQYLKTRSPLARWYRRGYLYPMIGSFLSGKCLDVGCGIGDFVAYRQSTVGIDTNPYVVDFCRENGLEVHYYDGTGFPGDIGTFDSFLLDNVLEHIEDPNSLMMNINGHSRQHARLLVGVPCLAGYRADSDHKRFYDEVQLIKLLNDFGWREGKCMYVPAPSWCGRFLKINTLYIDARRA